MPLFQNFPLAASPTTQIIDMTVDQLRAHRRVLESLENEVWFNSDGRVDRNLAITNDLLSKKLLDLVINTPSGEDALEALNMFHSLGFDTEWSDEAAELVITHNPLEHSE